MPENLRVVYNALSEQYDNNIKSLHWPSKERQELCFQAFIDNFDLNGLSILDIGCGFGDFYDFAKKNISIDYTGMDIAENLINHGKKKYPEIKEKLIAGNFLTHDVNGSFDVVLMSGIFNLKIDNNWAFMKESIKKAFEISKTGVCFNGISTYVDYMEDHLFYVDPCKVFRFCKRLTTYIKLVNDYNPYEFTMVLRHEK